MAEYVYETEKVGSNILQIVNDPFPSNPREEQENITSFYGDHRRYEIGDGKPPSDEEDALQRGGIRLLYRWLRRYKGVVAFAKVGMYDHSGVAYYTLPLDPPNSGKHPQDSGGFDSGIVGYAYITRERADELGAPLDSLDKQLEEEVKEYGDWANGNVWGYEVVEPCSDDGHEGDTLEQIAKCPHSEVTDSCFGYIGDDGIKDALADGRSVAA